MCLLSHLASSRCLGQDNHPPPCYHCCMSGKTDEHSTSRGVFHGLSLLYRLPQQKRTSPPQQILQLPSPPFCHCCVSGKIHEQSTSSMFHLTVVLVSFVQITTTGVAVSTIPDVTMCISLFSYKTLLYSLPLQEWLSPPHQTLQPPPPPLLPLLHVR